MTCEIQGKPTFADSTLTFPVVYTFEDGHTEQISVPIFLEEEIRTALTNRGESRQRDLDAQSQ